mgnify:CR=1 FL=1
MQKFEKYQEFIRLQEESGLSVKEFCENYGIHRSSFYYWAKKLKGSKRQSKFIPLHVGGNSQLIPAGGNDGLKRSNRKEPGVEFGEASIEIIYPNGVTIRLKGSVHPGYLKDFIHLQD